jgi:hypothetical protein
MALALTAKAREAVKRAAKASFGVHVSTRDAAGNRGSGAARRTLKR